MPTSNIETRKMENHDFLKPALSALAKLQIALDMEGGPSGNGQLFEQLLDLQNGILKSFGLPETKENESLLSFTAALLRRLKNT